MANEIKHAYWDGGQTAAGGGKREDVMEMEKKKKI